MLLVRGGKCMGTLTTGILGLMLQYYAKFIVNLPRCLNCLLFVIGLTLLTTGIVCFTSAQQMPETAEPDPIEPPSTPAQIEFSVTIPELPIIPLPIENNDQPYDDSLPRYATGNLFMLIEGAFGALIMTAAGLGAIIAAVLGAYKTALTLLVVAVGSFILRSLVSLFFGTNYPAYSAEVIQVPIIP